MPRKKKPQSPATKRTDVGYKRPPKEHQFKSGKSGNPKGRPKARALVDERVDVRAMAERWMLRPVSVTVDGKPMRMTALEAMLLKKTEEGLGNKPGALKEVLDTAFRLNVGNIAEQPTATTDLSGARERLRRKLDGLAERRAELAITKEGRT